MNLQTRLWIGNWPVRAAMFVSLCLMVFAPVNDALAQETPLGAGDIVRISVYGQKDLETVARLSSDGTITFPLLGSVDLGGLTVRQAEQKIAGELSNRRLVMEPQVTLFLERSQAAETDSVVILGEVARPGRYPIQAMTATNSENIAGVIAMAGGLNKEAANHVLLTRTAGETQATVRVDLKKLLERGNLRENHAVRNGDIAFVPRAEEFFVYGEVRNPGVYRLRSSMTVIQALSASGGLTVRGSEKGITVNRKQENGTTRNVKVDMDDFLQADDVLIVKEGLF